MPSKTERLAADPANCVDLWGLELQIVLTNDYSKQPNEQNLHDVEQMISNILNSGTTSADQLQQIIDSDKVLIISINLDRINDSTPGNDENCSFIEAIMSVTFGGDAYIRYNPTDETLLNDGTASVPEAELVHEIDHAFRQMFGKNPIFQKTREVRASATENEYRSYLGVAQRSVYGKGVVGKNKQGWPIPQYSSSYNNGVHVYGKNCTKNNH